MSVPRLTQIGLQVVFQRLGLWSTGGDIGARGFGGELRPADLAGLS